MTRRYRIDKSGYMESSRAIETLAALAQPTRMTAFRLLMQHEPAGLPSGDVARLLDVPQNTMSTHLAILERAGLISSERLGRVIVYRAGLGAVRELTSFLVNDCCGGRPELCEPLVAELEPRALPLSIRFAALQQRGGAF